MLARLGAGIVRSGGSLPGRCFFCELCSGVFFHADKVVRASDGVGDRFGRVSVKILAECGIDVQGVHQRFDGDMVGDIDLRDNSFEFFHEVAETLVAGVSEVPQI
uniref:Uncharacterized protein n=1 Tax=Brassica oleracea var. oleracea TaxID=109376 RepID=A0A0D3AQR7_BRAOL